MRTTLLDQLIESLKEMDRCYHVGHGPPSWDEVKKALGLAKAAKEEAMTEAKLIRDAGDLLLDTPESANNPEEPYEEPCFDPDLSSRHPSCGGNGWYRCPECHYYKVPPLRRG